MKAIIVLISSALLLVLGAYLSADSNEISEHDFDQLVWSDEFDYDGPLDIKKWSYSLGDGCPHLCGWGNNELEYYTDELKNAQVKDGKLTIALQQESDSSHYTSARIHTRGKGDWTYGRFEVRAIIPDGLGTWSAIWMLSSENRYGVWPHSGEIDIMEKVGYNPDSIVSALHAGAYNGMYGNHKHADIYVEDNSESFHTYALEWEEDQLRFFVDDEEFFSKTKDPNATSDEWPYNEKFHLILNLAYGGNWGGLRGLDNQALPAKMVIDYVRVYQ